MPNRAGSIGHRFWKLNLYRAVAAAAAVSLLPALASAGIDLVTNGSFEADGAVQYSGGILPSITGWSVTGQRVTISSAEGKTDGNFAAVFDDGTGGSNPASGSHSAQLTQTITVLPSTEYAVFYNFGVYGVSAGITQRVQVQAGSLNRIETRNSLGVGGPPAGFAKLDGHVFTTGGGGTVNLSFKDATNTGEVGTADGILDSIHMYDERVAYHTSFESTESNYTITSSNANPAHAVVFADPNYSGQASDGTQFLAFNGGGVGGNEGNAIVTSDAFSTPIGSSGHIFFDFGNYGPAVGSQSLKIEMIDATTLVPYFSFTATDTSGTTTANMVLDGYLLAWSAQSASSRIRVTDLSGAATPSSDALLDNIIVTIPEPGAATLLVAAPFAMRLRRRHAVHHEESKRR